jgi:acylphosphatase
MGEDREHLVRVRVFIGGRVQGVAYRFFAEKYAARLDVGGWVRNLPDGRVEVLAEGTPAHVETFLTRLRDGPGLARIDAFEVQREPPTGEFRDFRVVFFSG